MFAFEMLARSSDVRRNLGLEDLDVIGVHTTEPLVRRRSYFVAGVANHGFPARRIVDVARPEIPIPQSVVGAARSQCIALLTVAKRFFVDVALGDVAYHHREPAIL